jgi:hypothetical protein
MKGRQDRQHGDSGADPLGQGDTVLDSFPGEFRPVRLSLIRTGTTGLLPTQLLRPGELLSWALPSRALMHT